jgi:hypothetical protein
VECVAVRWTAILFLLAACASSPTRTMGTAMSGEEFERQVAGQVLSFRLPGPGGLDEVQFMPDGTAIYRGRLADGIGRWRPWTHGYCAYYPWLGAGVGLRPPFSGHVEHDGYHCYEVRVEDGYYVLFQRDGVYAGTLVPVPG